MNKELNKIASAAAVLSTLVPYLGVAWFLIENFNASLSIAHGVAFSMIFTGLIVLYQILNPSDDKRMTVKLLPLVFAYLICLSAGEYFVYFFTQYGRLEPLLALTLAYVQSLAYFGAINLFFNLKKSESCRQ